MRIKINEKFIPLIIVGLLLVVLISGIFSIKFASFSLPEFSELLKTSFLGAKKSEVSGFAKFSSEDDFKNYLLNSGFADVGYVGFGPSPFREIAVSQFESFNKSDPLYVPEVERISSTNVQVLGIDEPDTVKTDGREIYFSPQNYVYWLQWQQSRAGIMMPEAIKPFETKTRVIKAFPPADLALDSEIENSGDLLLQGNNLVIFSGNKIFGYNVLNPKSPEKKWTIDLKENNSVVASRLYNSKVYLITVTQINSYKPCPIEPLVSESASLIIKCGDIYHPIANIPIDTTYTAMVFSPDTGKIEKSVSFVGSQSQSVVYMSENNIYVTYSYPGDYVSFLYNFFKEKAKDLVPSQVISKMGKLAGYDISDGAKLVELQTILEKYYSSLSNDERLKVENEFQNRMETYYKDHKRDLEQTEIAKIDLADFQVQATGKIPGTPLNQFSLDEYKGNLRVATTVGNGFWGLGFGGRGDSANDVYVLGQDLKISGSVKDLGLEERIYSARFLGDIGYLVTFKQIDPFFVLDLSNPKKPELKGQLKIPGYSSYLHPLTDDKILGIGKEDQNVKISIFDVSDPENPRESAKYTLDEYWSDVLQNYHAFLLDKKHEVFFVPGSKGGYIFSYKNNGLELEKAVSSIQAKRAIYINDYMYIIAEDKIIVLNELNWERVGGLDF